MTEPDVPEPGWIVRYMGKRGMMAGYFVGYTAKGLWNIKVPEQANRIRGISPKNILKYYPINKGKDIEL